MDPIRGFKAAREYPLWDAIFGRRSAPGCGGRDVSLRHALFSIGAPTAAAFPAGAFRRIATP